MAPRVHASVLPFAGRLRSQMRVQMLGPLVVERDGRPIDLGGPRQRSVLAVLLLARGQVVSLDRLIDLVYSGEPAAQRCGLDAGVHLRIASGARTGPRAT